MRLRQHIAEELETMTRISKELDIDEFNTLIHKNCKQYLRLIAHKMPLYRGMDIGWGNYIGVRDVRKDRRPYGMSAEEASFLNDWLQDEGHARRDQSVMCSSNKEHVETFGLPHFIFPLDNISKYTWLHAQDMNIEGDLGWDWRTLMAWMQNKKGKATDIQKRTLEKLAMPFEDFFTTNSEFKHAYDRGYEMWIDCDKYYFAMAGWAKWDISRQLVIR